MASKQLNYPAKLIFVDTPEIQAALDELVASGPPGESRALVLRQMVRLALPLMRQYRASGGRSRDDDLGAVVTVEAWHTGESSATAA